MPSFAVARPSRTVIASFPFALAAALAACGGGTAPPHPVATAAASPTATPTVAASAQTTAQIVSGQPIALPSAGAFAGTVTYTVTGGAVPAGATVVLQSFVGAPAGAPQPQSVRRALDLTAEVEASLDAIFNTSQTISGQFAALIPGAAAGTQVTAETFDETTGSLVASISGTVPSGGGATTFTGTGQTWTTVPSHTYVTEFVVNSALTSPSPSPSASPSAGPTASASPAPSPTPTAPASVTITQNTIPGQPVGLTVSSGGVPYFLDQTDGEVGYLNANNAAVEFPIPEPTGVAGGYYFGPSGFAKPAFGSDGNLYFPHTATNSIGVIGPAGGTSVDTPIPTPSAGPWATVLGPDNAIWFTEYTAGKIGRLSNGTITEFALPSGTSAGPAEIVTGPDGALWFNEVGAGKMGRIPASATPAAPGIVEYPLQYAGCVNIGLTSGPLNSLWYVGCTGMFVGALDQVSLSGQQTIYQPPAGFGQADMRFVTTGSDGALWFSDQNANYIGRLAPSGGGNGTWSKYTYPLVHGNGASNASGDGIVSSPDGSIWWDEFNASNLGHLTF